MEKKSKELSEKQSVEDLQNPLRMGIASVDELEEISRAYRLLNKECLKKRYIISRENVLNDQEKAIIMKGSDIEIDRVKELKKKYTGQHVLKIFQPDEGICIVCDKTEANARELERRIYHHLMRLGGGTYEGFYDRVGSLYDFLNMFIKALFPKLVIIGSIPYDLLEMERINLNRVQRLDPYIRFIEIGHYELKPFPLFKGVKYFKIENEDEENWSEFLREVIREYTKPYFVEE